MSYDSRPNPDALLSALDEQERRNRRGQLRIFLGMSAGVGKTYAMLKAAHRQLKDGVNVVVGFVETHGRPETLALTEGLPSIARKKIEYRGTQIEEMDLEEILKRRPELVIVDELPHSNAPGSRHEKRYQDVIEILDAGIDVFTAFNVQHLESRKDSVEAITGISIRESVPDSLLERARLVELVDIAPTELLKRLNEGKVYLGDKAFIAGQNFFKEDKLTALREIALRITAEKVDHDLQKLNRIRGDGNPWQTNERLLVAVSHSPYSERLIRATRRLAYNLEAPWISLYVDTGISLNDTDQAQLAKNLTLARELNAEVITTTEVDVASAVRRISRQKNVTQVVVGRPTRRWFRDLIERGNLLQRLIHESLEVDIHVIRQDSTVFSRPSLLDEVSYYKSNIGYLEYWYTLCWVSATSILGLAIDQVTGYRSVGFLFLLAVIIVGIFSSLGAVVFSAFLSAFAWNYFFIPPKMTFAISSTEDFLMCLAFFIVAMITGFLTQRIRFHEKVIREREDRTNVLYEVLQDIANSKEKSDFLRKVTTRVGALLNSDCGVILKTSDEKLEFNEARDFSIKLDEKAKAVAQWSFENKKSAGWSTDTLSQSRALFLPLNGTAETVGIFVFQPRKKSRRLNLEKESLLYSIVRQLGISIERHFLTKRLADSQRQKDSEELQQTLLNSVSHEMRTPLTAILTASCALQDAEMIRQPARVRQLAGEMQASADRLNRVIENLLDMSRLSSGLLSLKLEWHDFNDLLSVVSQKLAQSLSKHRLKIDFLTDVHLVKMDYRLMEHAISNLILNACMYTPANTEIRIRLGKKKESFTVEVQDHGPGIAPDSMNKIFEKFYRVPGSPTGGTGLGLSIVKSIVELHHGKINAHRVEPHGVSFVIELPDSDQPDVPTEEQA